MIFNQKQKISLCMIVKNEEKVLRTCLDSIKDLVDEMIIVDTGSTDRTIEIAESYGAKVYSFEWQNDYALARNESLQFATGDWILYLDADERINEEDKRKIREIITDETISAVNVRVMIPQPKQNLVKGFSHDYCRLFRNIPGIKFEGRIHEQILPSILNAGGKIVKSDIIIDHFAFGISEEKKAERINRNIELLKLELKEKTNDPFLLYHLGLAYRALGEIDNAIQSFELILQDHTKSIKTELKANICIFLAQLYLFLNKEKKSIQCCYEAIDLVPNEPLPYYILAAIELQLGKYNQAKERLFQIIELMHLNGEGIFPSTEIDVSQVYLDLGNCYYLESNFDEAGKFYETAAQENPESLEVLFNLGNVHFKKKKYVEATKLYEQVLKNDPSFEPARQNLLQCYLVLAH